MLTIGIVDIGHGRDSAELYRDIVEYCTIGKDLGGAGCEKDQDHPPTITVSLLPNNPEDIDKSFHLAKHTGADFLVTTEKLSEDELSAISKKNGCRVFSLKENQTLKQLAKEVADYSLTQSQEEKRHNYSQKFLEEIDQSEKMLINFTQKISAKKGGIIFAETGAGPMAGAAYCIELAQNSLPYIMYSHTTAPDKNNAILGVGPDFKPYYVADIKLFKKFTDYLTIACNTAHAYFDVFEEAAKPKKLLDIRDASIDFLKENFPSSKKVILLGTPATIKARLYHQKIIDAGYEIIEPSEEEMLLIYRAIYLVKGDIIKSGGADYNLKSVKDIIMSVVKQIRDGICDNKAPVILGCTELNVPFSNTELARYSFVSTSGALSLASRKYSHGHYQEVETKTRKLAIEDTYHSSPDLSPMPALPGISPTALDISQFNPFGKTLKEKMGKKVLSSFSAESLLSIVESKERGDQYTLSDYPSDPSDNENDYIGLIEYLKNDKISVAAIPHRNKIHIKFPELNKEQLFDKIEIIKKKYQGDNNIDNTEGMRNKYQGDNNIRCHARLGYISCDIPSREFENLKKVLSDNKIEFNETDKGTSR